MEADELRAVERLTVDLAAALDANQAIGTLVGDRGFHARIYSELLGSEELLAVHFAVHNPAVDKAFFTSVCHRHGLEVVVVLEIRIHVLVPIQLLDDEVDVLMVLLGHVLYEQAPRNIAPFDHALVHAEHVAAPLRLIGAEASRGVEDAGVDEPTGAGLEAVGLGQI